jgi:hypothetical protein
MTNAPYRTRQVGRTTSTREWPLWRNVVGTVLRSGLLIFAFAVLAFAMSMIVVLYLTIWSRVVVIHCEHGAKETCVVDESTLVASHRLTVPIADVHYASWGRPGSHARQNALMVKSADSEYVALARRATMGGIEEDTAANKLTEFLFDDERQSLDITYGSRGGELLLLTGGFLGTTMVAGALLLYLVAGRIITLVIDREHQVVRIRARAWPLPGVHLVWSLGQLHGFDVAETAPASRRYRLFALRTDGERAPLAFAGFARMLEPSAQRLNRWLEDERNEA